MSGLGIFLVVLVIFAFSRSWLLGFALLFLIAITGGF